MEHLILQFGILIVAVLVFVNETGVPTGMPVELALLLCGALAVHSVPEFLLALTLVVIADVLGTLTIHMVARTGGSRLLGRVLQKFGRRGEESIARWRGRLGGHDRRVVLVGRMLPLVRMYISIGAGLLRFRLRDFILGAIPGSIVWAGTPLALGFLFHTDVDRIAAEYTRMAHYLFMVMPAFTVILAIAWWVRRGKSGWAKIRRGRSVLGSVVTAAAIAFLIRAGVEHADLLTAGFVAIGRPLLSPITWILLLAGLVAALTNLVVGDLHFSLRRREPIAPFGHPVAAEVASTVLWTALVLATGAIMIAMQINFRIL